MSIAEFYIDNGIDPGDPGSFDAFMEGAARGDMDGAWAYAGRRASERWTAEAEEQAECMAGVRAFEAAQERLEREKPWLSGNEIYQIAMAEAEIRWTDYIDDVRASFGLCSDSGLSEHEEDEETDVAPEQRVREIETRAAFVRRDRAAETSAAQHWPLNESEIDYAAETRGWDKIRCDRSDAPMAAYRRNGVRLNFWLSTGTVGSYLDHPSQGKTQLFRRDIAMRGVPAVLDNPRQHTGVGYHTREQHGKRPRPQEDPRPAKLRSTCSSTSSVCRCGENAASACAHGLCGKCCPGPCARHKR